MSSLSVSFLSALQASLSVLLTLSAGVTAARFGLLTESSAKDVSKLCVNMFLPALLIVNIGKNLSGPDTNGPDYAKILLWSFTYTSLSALLGHILTKLFKLPSWTTPAICFNNTTSLPLLLVQSLEQTGFLDQLVATGSTRDAVERAKSFFLVNSMVSNSLTFAFGPKLLELGGGKNRGAEEEEEEGENEGSYEQEANETTSLLPAPVLKPVKNATHNMQSFFHSYFTRLPIWLQQTLTFTYSLVNAPLIGALIALIIGLVPGLRRAFFADPNKGGIFTAWLTSAIQNVGDLFTALQMFVVGSKLNTALEAEVEKRDGDEDVDTGDVPKTSLSLIFFIRFIFWGVVADLVIWLLASKAGVLGNDPILWFAMMLMPVGPPAMILSSLAEEAGEGKAGKMAISKMLVYFYGITPVFCLPVVAGLKLSLRIMKERGLEGKD